jgi:hypothetical protein
MEIIRAGAHAPQDGLASGTTELGGTVIAPFCAPHQPTEPHG